MEAQLGQTLKSQIVGYCMGNKNDYKSKGLSHLQSEILSPFILDHWFRTELERGSEKGLFYFILGMQDVGYSQGVGFWFPYVFDATICIKMGY